MSPDPKAIRLTGGDPGEPDISTRGGGYGDDGGYGGDGGDGDGGYGDGDGDGDGYGYGDGG